MYQTESGAVITDGGSAAVPVTPDQTATGTPVQPGVDDRPAVTPPAPAPAVNPAATPVPAPKPVVTAPDTAAAAVAKTAPAGPRVRLVLRTEQDSWADIRDARQNRLLYETIPAGRVVSLEGVAPLSVFLGNVDGVRVEYNGQNFDTSPHKRGPVARFVLGEGTP
jgi:cytoskeleton protein RodZ